MRQRPVVAALPSRFDFSLRALFWAPLIIATAFQVPLSVAQARTSKTETAPYVAVEEFSGYLGRIGFNDPEQVAQALMRVEGLYNFDGGALLTNPVAIVVHGPEVSIFQKENYQEHKEIVDLAAKLTALGILDINVCEVRLNREGGTKDSVYPFVGTVPFGPAEVDRLLSEENYVYF